MKSQIGEDLEYRPGSTHLPALLLSPLCMSSVMVKNNMSGRFSHLEMFFFVTSEGGADDVKNQNG